MWSQWSASPWLDNEYLQLLSIRIEKFKWKSRTLINCRCFICGDSEKNKLKTRGYFLQSPKGWNYYCHNCQASHSLDEVLKIFFNDLYIKYVKDKIKEHASPRDDKKEPDKDIPYQSQTNTQQLEEKFKQVKQIAIPTIVSCKHLTLESKPIQYLISRKIPEKCWPIIYYTDNYSKLIKVKDTEQDERIVLIIRDTEKILGYIGRSITQNPIRYLVHMKEKSRNAFYNLDKVNGQQQVRVLEGALDSLFIKNSIAVGNSHLDKYNASLLGHEDAVLIFDNEPRNKEVMLQMRKAIFHQKKVCIWNSKFSTEKDINAMILNGKTEEDIEEYIINNTEVGLKARLAFQQYCQV